MRALLSVYDKTGLTDFAHALSRLGYELVSTGGTYRALLEAGLQVTAVEKVTGFPEILDGRVKTLHPRIHGGLLARTDVPEHVEALATHDINPIDVLVSNLYPFEQAVSDPALAEQDIIEQIDIGGPAMVRAAAKNFTSVVVVTSPTDYAEVGALLAEGEVPPAIRRSLAAKAFGHVSTYDSLVAEYLRADEAFPEELAIGLRRTATLRYGENPQQLASAYHHLSAAGRPPGVLDAVQLHGKEMSYNNLLDANAAWQAALISREPTVSIIKHAVPCGLATRRTVAEAFAAALEADTVSAFGGIVGVNQWVDEVTARLMSEVFFEVVIAPGFSDEALAILQRKKHLRLLQLAVPDAKTLARPRLEVRSILGGVLVQSADNAVETPETWEVVSKAQPTAEQVRDLAFAWSAIRYVDSNAIVLVKDSAIVGVGAGQPNRLESVAIAAKKAGARALGSVLASDAFFPFPDGVEAALAAGVKAIVQPGGSVNDASVIDAVDAAGAVMLFTGTRHFRH